MTTTGTWYPPPPPTPYHPSAGTGGFLLTTTNPPLAMISDLNPNIAEERNRPHKNNPMLQTPPRPTGSLWALEVPLNGARPVRCTIRAASLQTAIELAASRYPTARVDGIRELTTAEARGLGVSRG